DSACALRARSYASPPRLRRQYRCPAEFPIRVISTRRTSTTGQRFPDRRKNRASERRDLVAGGGRRYPRHVHPDVQGVDTRGSRRVNEVLGDFGRVGRSRELVGPPVLARATRRVAAIRLELLRGLARGWFTMPGAPDQYARATPTRGA